MIGHLYRQRGDFKPIPRAWGKSLWVLQQASPSRQPAGGEEPPSTLSPGPKEGGQKQHPRARDDALLQPLSVAAAASDCPSMMMMR